MDLNTSLSPTIKAIQEELDIHRRIDNNNIGPARLVEIDEHTIDTSMLPPHPKVLDLGCRGFLFAKTMVEMYSASVCAIDPGTDIKEPNIPGVLFERKAVVPHSFSGDEVVFFMQKDSPLGSHVSIASKDEVGEPTRVPTYKINGYWDLIKMDIEGGEYDILSELTSPIADQISIEFHEHTPARRGEEELSKILIHLEKWYDIHIVKGDYEWGDYNLRDVLLTRKFTKSDLQDNQCSIFLDGESGSFFDQYHLYCAGVYLSRKYKTSLTGNLSALKAVEGIPLSISSSIQPKDAQAEYKDVHSFKSVDLDYSHYFSRGLLVLQSNLSENKIHLSEIWPSASLYAKSTINKMHATCVHQNEIVNFLTKKVNEVTRYNTDILQGKDWLETEWKNVRVYNEELAKGKDWLETEWKNARACNEKLAKDKDWLETEWKNANEIISQRDAQLNAAAPKLAQYSQANATKLSRIFFRLARALGKSKK